MNSKMKRKHILPLYLSALLLMTTSFASCSEDDPVLPDTVEPVPLPDGNESENETDDEENNNNEDTPMTTNLTITVGSETFAATLADNDAARAFSALLPLTINMSELNGNEKYYYLDSDLPTASHRPGTIHAGDLMLYGSSCLVLFYETFSSGYSYTRLGQLTAPEGLAAAVGRGSVRVTIEAE